VVGEVSIATAVAEVVCIVKKLLAVGAGLLFIGIALTSSINADIDNKLPRLAGNHHMQDMQIQISMEDFLGKSKTCYGYQAYPNPDLLVWFGIDDPGTLNTIGTPISSDKIAGGTWVDGVWWCCEYTPVNNSNIWIIDHLTGNMTLVGTSGSSEELHGLAYDDTTGTMYACGATNLFIINMSTGAATLVGPFGISSGLMIGIACDGNGNIYGEDLHTDSLYSIDPASGAATLIGLLGLDLNHGQDMAFDKEDGICYLSAFTVHAGNEGALYTCNLTTGATTKIGNFGAVPTQITGFVIPYSLNDSPDKPIIEGSSNGKAGEVYEYTFITSDPEGDDVYYWIEWGDDTVEEWIGPHASGKSVTLGHSWSKKGNYTIGCKARDIYDAESDWATLEVTMPKNKAFNFNFPLLSWLFERFPNAFPMLRCILRL